MSDPTPARGLTAAVGPSARRPVAPAPSAADLLLGGPQLAARARTTLAAADVATVVGSSPRAVTVVDRDGEPELVDPPDDLAAGARRGRRITLVVAPRLADGVWLVLDGALRRRGEHVVVAVDAVRVGCPHGHGHAQPVDLADYATAAPDLLRACMPRVVEHSNAEHGPELRELAARRLGVAAADVAAARLSDLTAAGVDLDVVDAGGGRRVRLPFARAAVSPADLGALLRAALIR